VINQASGTEAPLVAAADVLQSRAVNAGHFACTVPLAQRSHVLLIDDTWTTGGHAQSAVLSLREAGATRVSVLVVARWLKADYADNKQFIADMRTRDFSTRICPWTGEGCP
jgi:orotate phosphoribosyltransferase